MKSVCALVIAAACVVGCKKGGDGGSQTTAAQAIEVLSALAKPGADQAALTNALRPKPEDYAAVFVGDSADKMKTAMDQLWDSGKLAIKPKPEQTEVKAFGVAQKQLATGEGHATHCPGGYKKIADKIKPSVVVYCARFVKPGEKLGLSVDGLVYVNNHWAIFPKPFRVLK
jgi:hypothetical protein